MARAPSTPFGFLMVTTDPALNDGGRGDAYAVIQARLNSARWPIYKDTRNRQRLGPGARLAFYVGGTGRNSGMIVATARVASIFGWRWGDKQIDPEPYLTDLPHSVLSLEDIHWLNSPVRFKDRLDGLSFCPKDKSRWGAVLVGGCRSISEADWMHIFYNVVPKVT